MKTIKVTFGNLSNSFSRSLLKKRLPFNKLEGRKLLFRFSKHSQTCIYNINPPFSWMTTAKVVLCQNQGGLGYLGLLFPPGIFKRPNVCKLGGTNVNTNFHLGEDGLSLCDRL